MAVAPPPPDCTPFNSVCVAPAYTTVTDYIGLFSRMDAKGARYVIPEADAKRLGARIVVDNRDYNPPWEITGMTALPQVGGYTLYYRKTCATAVQCHYEWGWVLDGEHPMLTLNGFTIDAADPTGFAAAEAAIWLHPTNATYLPAKVLATASTDAAFQPTPWVYKPKPRPAPKAGSR